MQEEKAKITKTEPVTPPKARYLLICSKSEGLFYRQYFLLHISFWMFWCTFRDEDLYLHWIYSSLEFNLSCHIAFMFLLVPILYVVHNCRQLVDQVTTWKEWQMKIVGYRQRSIHWGQKITNWRLVLFEGQTKKNVTFSVQGCR